MAGKMETLRVQVKPEKAEFVRKAAMDTYGYGKGAISKALNAAIDEWLEKNRSKHRKVSWKKLRGVLAHVKMNSVELQHADWNID